MMRNVKSLIVLIVVFTVGQFLIFFNVYSKQGNGRVVFSNQAHKRNLSYISRSIFKSVNGHTEEDRESSSTSTLWFLTNSFNITRKVKQYANFNITEPRFIDNHSRELFYRRKTNVMAIGGHTESTRHGEIFSVRNGTFDVRLDCGYKSHRTWVHPNRTVTDTHWYPVLVPLVVPDGHTFQHFIDGTLPKLIQALPLLQNRSVKILLPPLRDKIILEMLYKLGIVESQLVFHIPKKAHVSDKSQYIYGADLLLYPCITPPLHPELWKEARNLISTPEGLQIPLKQGYIVFVARKICHNPGRMVLNRNNVIKMLTTRFGHGRVKVFTSFSMSLEEANSLFGNARIIMGPHGGGMYNINFAPSKTVIIEFMPTYDNGKMVAESDQMIWKMAQLLDQEYWRLSAQPTGKKGNMNVDINKLEQILDVVDKKLFL